MSFNYVPQMFYMNHLAVSEVKNYTVLWVTVVIECRGEVYFLKFHGMFCLHTILMK